MDTLLNILNSDAAVSMAGEVQSAIANLGDGAVYVAEIYVKQQMVDGANHLASAFVGLIIIIISIFGVKWILKNDRKIAREDSYYQHVWLYSLIVPFFAILFSVISMNIDIQLGVGKLINPEYYAIQEAVEFISGSDYGSFEIK